MVVLILGCALSAWAAHSTPYPLSDHYDGRHFRNTAPVPPETFWVDVKVSWEMLRTRTKWPKRFSSPQSTIPHEIVRHGISATFIGHSSVLLQVDGTNILTDPVFSDRIGLNRTLSVQRVTNPGIRLEDLPHIDVVLISHDHYDHLDLPTLQKITARQASSPPLILTGLGNEVLLKKHGVTNVRVLDWGDSVQAHDLKFHFLEAVHTSRRGLFDTNKTLWGAFLIETSQGNIYFAGDTAYGDHFKRVYERFGPTELALLPIGAYKPRWFMWREHMDPEAAVLAHLDLHSAESIAVHFGTFNSAAEGYNEPVRDLEAALQQHSVSSESFLILKQGQTTTEDASGRDSDKPVHDVRVVPIPARNH